MCCAARCRSWARGRRLQYEVEQYQRWHCRRVLEAKPGITGLWQVAGRSRTTFDEMVRLDLRYARTRSLWTDIKILLATPARRHCRERAPAVQPWITLHQAPDVKLGKDVRLSTFINLYGCEIGDETKIGAFVEIQKNATVGKRCKISSHTFICEGVTIEDNVFIGHGVTFVNDIVSARDDAAGDALQTEQDWKVEKTLVKKGASIGSGVDDSVERHHRRRRHRRRRQRRHARRARHTIVAGNPARVLRTVSRNPRSSE